MRLKDLLQPKHIIKTRDNRCYLILDEDIILGQTGFLKISHYNDNLKIQLHGNNDFSMFDIMEIYSPRAWGSGFELLSKISESRGNYLVDMIWKREEPKTTIF